MEIKCDNDIAYLSERRFLDACRLVCGVERERAGIGTLGEKTLHAALKRFIEPDASLHEIKIGRSYADVYNADGIFEIQTRAFNALRKKLGGFLEKERVTVVYPIPATKYLVWMNEETAELTSPRKSPRRGSYFDVFKELYKLDRLFCHPNFRLLLLLIDMDEYRLLDGWGDGGKRGATRYERIPTALAGVKLIASNADYLSLLPQTLPESFTAKNLAAAAKIRLAQAQVTLTVLSKLNAVKKIGMEGRAHLYERAE